MTININVKDVIAPFKSDFSRPKFWEMFRLFYPLENERDFYSHKHLNKQKIDNYQT